MNVRTIRTMGTMNTENQEMTFEDVYELVKNMSLPQAKPREGALMMTCLDGKLITACSGSAATIVSMLLDTMNKNEIFARTVVAVSSQYLYEQGCCKNNKNNGNNE